MAQDETVQEAYKMVQLSSDRTILSSERTYASWIRTGLTALIAGLAVMRFMADVLSYWEMKAITFILIIFSVFCFITAAWRQRQLQKWLPRAEFPHLPFLVSAGCSAMLTFASMLALVALWHMEFNNY